MTSKLLLSTLCGLLLWPLATFAQSPSPTSIRDAVKEQVAQELSNIKQAVAKKGYVGTISTKADLTLTITNLKNQSRTATVTTDTTIKLAGGKEGTPADLKVGDFVIAMGDSDSNGVLTTKRLLVTAQPATDKRGTVFGSVTKVAGTAISIETPKKETWTVTTSSTTKYTGTIKTADIKVGGKIVAAGTAPTATTLTAGFIHLFPAQ